MKRREFLRNALVTLASAPAVTDAIARATEPAPPDMMVAYWFCTPMTYHYTPEYLTQAIFRRPRSHALCADVSRCLAHRVAAAKRARRASLRWRR